MLNEHASKGFCAKIFWAIPKIRLIFSLILQINPPQVNLPQVNPPQVNSPQVNHPKCKPPKCNLPAGQSSCRSIFPQVNPPQIKLPKWNLPKFKTLKCNPPWAARLVFPFLVYLSNLARILRFKKFLLSLCWTTYLFPRQNLQCALVN